MDTIPSMKSMKVVVKSPDTGTPLWVPGIDTLGDADALGEADGEAVWADPEAVKAGAPTDAVIAKLRVTV